MIKASEARKVTKEAQEALKQRQTLAEARELEKKFRSRMTNADKAVKAAMTQGDDEVSLRWTNEELPQALRERFEKQVEADGFSISVHVGDDGDGWEVTISWKG